jgi:hypothetical protein
MFGKQKGGLGAFSVTGSRHWNPKINAFALEGAEANRHILRSFIKE